MAALLRDLRYAIRMLARSPGFTLIALLTLAIGTGANATVFGFVSALLLRPAPGVADPRSLAAIYTSDFSSGPYGDSSYPDFLSLQAGTSAFSGMAASQDDAIAVVRVQEAVERLRMESVSGGYFGVLGVSPEIGRLIGPGDTDPRAPPVAVIGYRLWERAFDANPAVLGTPLVVNGRSYTIVGVASRRFEGLDLGRAFEIWTPLIPPPVTPASRTSRGLSVVARLSPGASLREAQSQVSAVAERLARDYPDSNLGTLAAPDKARPMLMLQHTRMPPQFRGMVWTLGGIIMGAAALVLLIACANIASLLLSRAASRDREMAVRLALGAAPGRLVRQLLTESVLLGLAAGALGLLFALWTADLLPSFFPAEQARMLDTSVDMTTVGFVLAVGLASSVLFGLAPALQAATPSALAALRTGTGGLSDGRGRSRLRRTLVMAQVAVSVVLLVSAALLVQSLRNAVNADLGFTTRKAALASVELPDAEFNPAQGLAYYREAVARLQRLPGVEAAGLVRTLPLGLPSRRGFRIDGYEPRAGEDMELPVNIVSGGYFSAMGIQMLAGRTFDARDGTGGAPVAIVNDLLAARFFGGEAIGRAMTDSRGRRLEIVGVARTGTNVSVQEPPVPLVYYPLDQEYASRMT
ncbi:MAG TPA: ABC transporter permease, partial [Vicinamibacterales bacterium]|nr:ABC transporter permease [Vicinamibacterales bacterium]